MQTSSSSGVIVMCASLAAAGCASPVRTQEAAPRAEPETRTFQAAAKEIESLGAFMATADMPRADWYRPESLASGDVRAASEGMVAAQGNGRRYRVFFGGLAEGLQGRISYHNTDPEVRVNTGYGLAWGWRPYLTTTRVTTATDGTTVMAQIGSDNVHRIILLSGGTVRVETREGDDGCVPHISVQLLTEPWTYVECTATDTDGDGVPCYALSAPAEVSGTLRDFVRSVLKRQRVKQLMSP